MQRLLRRAFIPADEFATVGESATPNPQITVPGCIKHNTHSRKSRIIAAVGGDVRSRLAYAADDGSASCGCRSAWRGFRRALEGVCGAPWWYSGRFWLCG